MLKDESHIVRSPTVFLRYMHNYCGRLDTIGLAGFSHNFGALQGKHAQVTEVFDTFGASPRSSAVNTGLLLLAHTFPFLADIPTSRTRLIQKLTDALEEISNVLLSRTQKELEMGVVGGKEERSVIGLLSTSSILNVRLDTPLICSTRKIVKGANKVSEFHLTKDEVIAQVNELRSTRPGGPSTSALQMKVLLVGGYETTSGMCSLCTYL